MNTEIRPEILRARNVIMLKGKVFDKIGNWFFQVSEVLETSSSYALTVCENEKKEISYFIFKKRNEDYDPIISSLSLSSILREWKFYK